MGRSLTNETALYILVERFAEMETRRRIQAEASAWRKVEGVMGGRYISWKLKEKVLCSCIRKGEYRN